MRPSSIAATLVTSAAAMCASLAAPPGIAAAEESAQETIANLQAQGYTVNVDRVGSARIDDCEVTSVRNPQTRTRTQREYYGRTDANGDRKYRYVEVIVGKSISVSLDCTG